MKMRFVWPLLGFLILGSCEEAPLYLGMASPSVVSPSMASLTADFRETRLHRAEAVLEGLLTEGDWLSSLGIGLMRPGGGGTGATGAPDLMVELFAGWVFEDSPVPAERTAPAVKVGGDLVLSRTYVVPRAVVRQGRRDTARESCIRGEEDLAALRDLAPPYIALRVNGLSVGDEGYPLVWVIQARIRIDGEGRGGRTDRDKKARVREEALAQLEAGLRERLAVAPDLPVEPRPELFWLAAAGDLMLGRGAGDILLREGPGGIFGETAALFKEADLAILNLEGTVSRRGSRAEKTYTFRFPPAVAGALRDAGIDAALLANNHSGDFGPDAFLDTLTHLEAAGIGILGAGRDLEAAAAPYVFAPDGGSGDRAAVHAFGIASFLREASGWDGLSIAAGENRPGILHAGRGGGGKLKEQFSPEALDLVFFHGGIEWTAAPDARTRQLYTELIRAGADIIIGSHPHMVQGFEWIQDKPVFWSLGNFVFAGMENTGGGDEGLFIRLGFWGTGLLYIEPYPLALSGPRTKIAPPEKLKGFYELSK